MLCKQLDYDGIFFCSVKPMFEACWFLGAMFVHTVAGGHGLEAFERYAVSALQTARLEVVNPIWIAFYVTF